MEYKFRHYWNKKLRDLNLNELEFIYENGFLNIREYVRAKLSLTNKNSFENLKLAYPRFNHTLKIYKSFEALNFTRDDIVDFINIEFTKLYNFYYNNFDKIILNQDLIKDFLNTYTIVQKTAERIYDLYYQNYKIVDVLDMNIGLWNEKNIIRKRIEANDLDNFMDTPPETNKNRVHIIYSVATLAENGLHKEALNYLEKYKNLIDFKATGFDSSYYYWYYKAILKDKLGQNFDEEYKNLMLDYAKNNKIILRCEPSIQLTAKMYEKYNDEQFLNFMLKAYKNFMKQLLVDNRDNALFYMDGDGDSLSIRNIEYIEDFQIFLALYVWNKYGI